MPAKITDQQLDVLVHEFGYEKAAIQAIIHVETPGYGFHPKTGFILINFEPHIFKRYCKLDIPDGDGTQKSQWEAFEKAKTAYPTFARLSTSFGMGQIMGFNFKAAGYETVEDMVYDFRQSEYAQVRGMFKFIKSNKKLHTALLARDWKQVAYYYNGSAYRINRYDEKLKAAYEKFSK